MKGVIFWLCVLGCVFLGGWLCGWKWSRPEPVEVVVVKRDTVEIVKRDTIRETETRLVREVVVDTVWINLNPNLNPNTGDEIAGNGKQTTDSVELLRVQREFAGDHYRAWVSGVEPWLDSVDVEREIVERVVTITEREPKKPPKRWGVGPAAGVTWDFGKGRPGWYVGFGLQYNIIVSE